MSEDLGEPKPWRANAPSWAGANWDRANGAWREATARDDLTRAATAVAALVDGRLTSRSPVQREELERQLTTHGLSLLS
jgi:hypothetical protein